MKYIYIFSDTHSNINGCIDVLNNAVKVDAVIHAGDYTRDADNLNALFNDIPMYCVRGNGDFFSGEPNDMTVIIDGVRIFITHGHMYNVKYEHDYRSLKERGRSAGADLIVFGHTHIPVVDTDGVMTVVNPGSAGYGRTYAVAKIDNGNVRADIFKMY